MEASLVQNEFRNLDENVLTDAEASLGSKISTRKKKPTALYLCLYGYKNGKICRGEALSAE